MVSFLAGMFTQFQKRKIDALHEQYKNLYIPYFKLILIIPDNFDFKQLRHTDREKIRNLFKDNCFLMGKKSSELLFDYYLLDSGLNVNVNIAKENLDERTNDFEYIFLKMESALLNEGSKISKKLRYPNLSKTISKLHSKNLKRLKTQNIPKIIMKNTN